MERLRYPVGEVFPMTFRYSVDPLRNLLLKYLQGESLDERPEASEWLRDLAIAFRTDLGLLALHGRSGLAEQLPEQPLIRVPLCAADNLILLLTHNAIQARQHLGIAIPPGTVMMPILIMCKTLLGDLLNQQETLGNADRPLGINERGGLLVVSPDAEMRVRYFSMRVGSESVVTSYPACRMRPDGSVTTVSAKQANASMKQFSVCFFLAHQKQMPNPGEIAFKPAVVILDLTHDHWIERMSEVIEWCIQLQDTKGEQAILIAILPFGDRLSNDALNSHGISIFPLDSPGILEIVDGFAPITPSADKFAREVSRAWSFSAYASEKPLDRKHTIYHVPDEAAADVLVTIKYIYQALNSMNENLVHRDLRLAGWLVGTLMQLPIPIQWYEQHAFLMGNRLTLKKLISGIGNNAGGTLHLSLAPILQSLRGQLDLLYTRLSAANPKSEAFLHYYREHLQPFLVDDKNVALLTRNDVVARALWPWLLSEGISAEQQPHLRVLTYKQVDGREMFDHMIATGTWPSRYRWQIGGRLGRTMDFILYRGEEDALEQQMRSFYGAGARSFFERTRFSMLQLFGDISSAPKSNTRQTDQPSLDFTIPGDSDRVDEFAQQTMMPYKHPKEVDEDLKSLFDLVPLAPTTLTPAPLVNHLHKEEFIRTQLMHWRDDSFHDSGEQPELDRDDELIPIGGTTESCVLLKVRMTSTKATAEKVQYLYLNNEGATECYIPGQDDDNLNRVANNEIEPGFILIRTDQEDRQTLFDQIVQLADAQPTMKYLKVWREHWLEAIHSLVQKHASGKAKHGSYQHLQQQLAKAGVRVTTVTVRDWVLGERIGPGNLNSIKAIGILSQHPMLQQYPEQVDAAFRQIRTIHQVLGRRISATLQSLGKVIQKSSVSPKATKREVQLDPALSVPIDDLLDLLQFWEVVEAAQGQWDVPSSRVGMVLPIALYGGG